MSNVLIGIIGVILFIGLALAGALILGDDFRSSKSSSSAATTVAQLQQIVAAINMSNLKTGTPLLATTYDTNTTLLIPRFLKVAPVNPLNRAGYRTVDVDGFGRALPVDHVYTILGLPNDAVAKATCRAIEEQNGAADPDVAIADVTTVPGWATRIGSSKGVGCFLYTATTEKGWVAFLRV